MTDPSTITAGRTWPRALRAVVAFSLTVTAAAGVFATALHYLLDISFGLSFVYLRWGVVFTLVATPLLSRTVLERRGRTLPYVMRTPLTAVMLACESIVVDIIVAELRRR